jgi:uncharacterized repeat protein (TIGR01451 family)/gliding motility-associated-like protein
MGTKNNHSKRRVKVLLNRTIKITLLSFLFIIFSFSNSNGQAIMLDLNNSQLNFLNSNRQVITNTGNSGRNQGSVHRYNNVVTKNGITVYGILTIQEVNNATITNFDDDATYGIPARFQPRIGALSSAGGFIVYHLRFYDQATNQDVFLYNYYLTGVDVDGNSSSNREFNEHGGYTSYTVNNPTQLVISTNSSTGRTRFLGRTTSLDGLNFDNSASYIMNYTNPNNIITFALGQTGQNDERYYSLNFGPKGGTFGNPDTHTNPLPLAIDDIGIPVNSNTGGTAVNNVLTNDLYDGLPVLSSAVDISLIIPASNPGITLNTATGAVSVAPNTPAGNYTLVYQICMKANPAGRCDLATVTVYVREANLSITKTDSPDPVLAGNNVTYTITVTNNGPTEAAGVEVTDNLPSGLTFVSATPSVGSWNGNKWTVGSMANGATATLSLVATVSSSYSGSLVNTATVTSATYDPVPGNNSASQSTTVNRSANLSIVKTDSPDPAVAGQSLTYSITVTNLGPSDASTIVVNDVFPSGVTFVSANASSGTWNSPNWTIPSIVAGASANITILTSLGSNLTGTVTNTALIQSSGTPDPDNTNNSSSQTTTINTSADVSVVKTLTTNPIVAGENVAYSITVANSGPSNASTVQLTDVVTADLSSVQFSIDGGSTWNSWSSPYAVGNVNAGSTRQLLIKGSLAANAVSGSSLINSASVTSSTPDPNSGNNSSSVAGIITTRADMSIVKTGPATVTAGTKITYSLTVVNNGPSYAAAISIADAVPSGISNAEYSLNNGNSWGVWNGTRNLPLFNYPGVNNILIRGDVAPGFTGSLVNTATVTTTTNDPNSGNNSSTVTTNVSASADLVISKTQTIAPLKKNGQANYVITVFNNGPSDVSSYTITDNISSSVISNAEYYNGSSWVAWTGSLNVGNLLVGATYSLQIRGTVTNTATDPVTNTASVSSASVSDPNLANNTVTINSSLDTEADLRITKTAVSTINAGENIQYSILVENLSPNMNATDVLITDNVDDSKISTIEYSLNGGSSWSSWTGSVNIGTLNFGTNKTILIKGGVLSNASGIIDNTASVSSSTADPVTSNNSSSISTTITVQSDIAVEKTIVTAPSSIVAGSVIEYLVRYRNYGPSDASNYLITDIVPVGLLNVVASRCQSAFITWPGTFNAGTVVAGGTCTILIKGTIATNFSGGLTNTVTVTSNATDPNPANNIAQVSTSVNANADLLISMAVLQNPVIAGDVVNYSVNVENLGPSDAQDVVVSNVTPSGIQSVQYSIDGSTWNTWTGSHSVGTITYGGSYTFYMRGTTVSSLTNGSLLTHVASVASGTSDPVLLNNTAQATATIQTNSDLAMLKLVDNERPSAGDQVVYTLRVTNQGLSDATGVYVADLLPSGVDYVSSSGVGSYNGATGIWTIGNLVVAHPVELEITAAVNPSGDYLNTAVVSGNDLDADLSNNESSVVIIPDIESVYTVSPPQNVDSYLNGQTLATVSDADGNIVSSTITAGTLPAGTAMNPITGSVSVVNASLLLAGSYTFTVRTVDAIGGITIQPVTIVIGPDIESVYWVASARNVDDYDFEEYLASVSDADGEIVSATINTGTVPPGTVIDPFTGTIVVANPELLVAGSYPLTITTVDITGGRTTQSITIVIGPDIEALYTVNPPRIVDSYRNGDTLAIVTDEDGILVLVNLLNSDPHPGISFNPATGVITVADSTLLVAGSFDFEVETEDNTGGKSLPTATIVINPDIESVYTIEPARNVDAYSNSDLLATVSDANGAVVSATINSGTLPSGASFNSTSGVITVSNAAILVAGSYPLTITTVDEIGGITTQLITIVINPDIESIYTVVPAGNVFDYTNGQSLATVTDADGDIVSAVVTGGSLPPGTTINPVTGEVTVSNYSLLQAGSFTFTVTTIDETGGITTQPVTIRFLAADLAITKTSSPSFIVAGENLTYTITVTNIGPDQALDVKVTDNIPSELGVVSITPSVGSWSAPEWSLGNLASGSSETLTIVASLPSGSTGTLTNTATVSSQTSDPILANNSDTDEASINALSDLTVTISDVSDPVIAGDTVEYTITVTNEGPSDAHDIILADVFPSELSSIRYSADGGLTWLNWMGNHAHSTLVAGASFSIRIKAIVHPGTSHGHEVMNPVSVSSLTPDADLSNNTDNEETVIERLADMSVVKTGPVTIVAGTKVVWGLTVINHGPSWADAVSIADAIPAGVTNPQYSLNNGNSWGMWSGKRNLPLFETDPGVNNILIRGDLAPGFEGTLANTATVSTTTNDPVSENNLSFVETEVTAEADLALTKEILTSPVHKNQLVTYKVSVINLGPSDASDVLISDAITPTQITGAEYSITNGSSWASWSGSVIIAELNHNATVEVLIRGTITNNANNPVLNTATVSSPIDDPDPDNNSQTISTPLEIEADLSVVKTAELTINAGDTIRYTITVTNNSPNMDATNVVLTDNVNHDVVESPAYSVNGGTSWSSWTGTLNLGTLVHGSVQTVLVKGKVLSNSTGNLVNSALIGSGVPDPDLSNNESEVTTQITRLAEISVIKELLTPASEVVAGNEIRYLITYHNDGPSDATNFIITDIVPAGLTNVESSRCRTAFVPWNGSFNAGTVVAGGTCTILIRAILGSNTGGIITNTASVLSEVPDPDLSNNSASVDASIASEADLSITKTANKEPVIAGENITYTIRISNNGPSSASNVTVADVLPSGLTLVSSTATSGSWLTPVWSVGTLANGGSAELTLTAKVGAGIAQGTVLSNTAVVSTSTTDPVAENNSATEVTSVASDVNLVVTKSGSPDPVLAGENITYTIEVTNTGPSNATNVVVTDNLPSEVSFVSASGNGVNSNGVVTWSLGSLLAANSATFSIVVKSNSNLSNGTLITNSAIAVANGEEPVVSIPDEITVITSADLSVVKVAESNIVFAGENIIYTILVTNNGPSKANNLVVTDELPDEVTFVSASGGGTFNNGMVTWNRSSLLVSEQVAYTLVVKANTNVPVGTIILNSAITDSDDSDPVPSDPEEVTVEASSNFTITKTASNPVVSAGENVTYTIRVTNFGPGDAENIAVIDTLAAGLTFVSATNNPTHSNGIVSWIIPSLLNGQSSVFELVANVSSELPSGTEISNVVTMIPDGGDTIVGDPEIITIVNHADLTLFKSASVTQVDAGDDFTYTLFLTNSGPSTGRNIVISDVLPAGVTFVSATNGGTFSNGTVSWNLASITKGSVVNFSFTVNVLSTLEPGTIIRNMGTAREGEKNPISSNTVEVLVTGDANLSLYKTAEQLFVYAGQYINYSIQVVNNGPSLARNVVVYDLIPEGTTFHEAFDGGVIYTDRVIWNIASIGVGESKILKMTVKVNSSVPQGTIIRNVAVGIDGEGDDPDVSNEVDVPVITHADLSIVKTGWPKPVNAGDDITYTFTIKNNGPSDASVVKVKDLLPDYLTFISLSSPTASWNDSILTIGSVAANETVIVSLKAKVDPSTPLGYELVNTAVVSSAVTDPDLTNNSSTDRTLVSTMSDVSITKSGPSGIVAGTSLRYRLNVFNAGPSHAQSVIVADTVSPLLTNVQFSTDGGIIWNVWTGSYTIGELASGSLFSIILRGNLDASATGSISNTALVGTSTDDPNPDNNTDTEVTPIVIEANVSINKSGPATVIAGQQLLYTFTLSPGTSDATNVVVTDIVPSEISNAQYSLNSGSSWSNWPVSNQILIGTLYAGSPIQLLLKGDVSSDISGTIMNTVIIETESYDPDLTNNIDSVEVGILPLADLTIRKTDGQDEYVPGTTVVYTITVDNVGPSLATGARVTDFAPAGTNITSWSATGSEGTLFTSSGTGNIDQLVTVPVGGTIVYTVSVSVPASQQGALQNVATVLVPASVIDPVTSNNTAIDVDLPNTNAELTVVKTSSAYEVVAGENVTYTIRVDNKGPNVAYNVVISDTLAPGLTFVSASAGGVIEGNVVRWTIASMANGASFPVSIEVKVNSNVPEGTIIRNIAVAGSDNTPDPPTSDPIDITIINRSALTIDKTASVSTIQAGVDFYYSIKVTNNGPSDITNVAVRDSLPDALLFVSADNGGTFSNGVVSWTVGSIVSGQSATVKVFVKASAQIAGGTVVKNIAVVQKPDGDPIPSPPEEVTVTNSPTFSIVKEAAPNVVAGENLTYTIKVTNTSTTNAVNVLVSDTLKTGLTFVSGSAGNKVNGNVITWLLASLSAESSIQFTITAKTDKALATGSTVSNMAYVTSENTDTTYVSKKVITTVTGDGGETTVLIANDDIGNPIVGIDGGVAVPNVLVNDFYGNETVTIELVTIAQVSSSSPLISVNPVNGQVIVDEGTPAGSYELVYRICLITDNQVCDEATVTVNVSAPTIVANDDAANAVDNMVGGVAVADVTDNDQLNGLPFDISQVILTVVEPAAVPGITLNDQTGEVYVAAGTPVGDYQITYQICDVINPSVCDNAIVSFSVNNGCVMVIPTGFSPNGDNFNERFEINCLENYPDAKIEIFNRWGNLVFKKEHYGNIDIWGDTDAWWDGTSTHNWNIGDEKLPPGTYFYVLDLNSGDEKPLAGSIFINR